MEIIFIIIWLLLGLLGSCIGFKCENFSWKDDWKFGLIVSLFGVANFVTGIIIWFLSGRSKK